MRAAAWVMCACLTQVPAQASQTGLPDLAGPPAAPAQLPVWFDAGKAARDLVHAHSVLASSGRAQADRAAYTSPLGLAMERARKKGVIELGVDGYTEVLIQCQKNQSIVLATPLLRSNAQRDHCYRF